MQWWKRSVLKTGLEMSFKEREGGTVTEGLRKGFPEFGGHGAERPATQGEKSGTGNNTGLFNDYLCPGDGGAR